MTLEAQARLREGGSTLQGTHKGVSTLLQVMRVRIMPMDALQFITIQDQLHS